MTLRFVVDTDVISETARPSPDEAVVRWLTAEDRIAITALTVYELARGIELAPAGRKRRFLEDWFARLLASSIQILPFDRETALAAARLGALGRRRGRSLEGHDLFIAAAASILDVAVATHNVAHFRGLGISVFDPFTNTFAI